MATSTALVVSGGGSRGAYAVGIIRHLFRQHRDSGWFRIVGGTSTGALIAPMAALMGGPDPLASEALEVLMDAYGNSTTERIVRKRGFLRWFWSRDAVYDTDPLRELVEQKLRPEMFQWLSEERAPHCYVTYTNYRTGQLVHASPGDPGITREDFIAAVIASASIPIALEPARIDGDICYDGGVREILPMKHAIELGAERILPVTLSPPELPRAQSGLGRIDRVATRTLDIMTHETVLNDAHLAELINIAVRARRDLQETFSEDAGARQRIEQILARPEYGPLFDTNNRLVEIVAGLQPDERLTDNSLEFDPEQMRRWIEMGEEKAREVITENPFA